MDRDYNLTTQWIVTSFDGTPIGRVVPVADGYRAERLDGAPMYPHLRRGERDGVTHADVDGAARELMQQARDQGVVSGVEWPALEAV